MVLLFVSAFMVVSAAISCFNGMDSAFYPLLLSSLLTALLGAFPLIFVEKSEQITNKEGYCIVVGSWLVACVVGMFPYLIWGGEFNLINSWFESVSGFTTTGASILNDVEALPRGMHFWRMSSTWIGGIGVVMFALVILPSLGRNKQTLSSVELSTLAKDNYRYRTQMIVQILLVVYVGLTIVSTLSLRLAGMGWFDAVTHAMSACATSGFSTRNSSIGYYDSFAIESVLMVTMLIAGMHFGLIYSTVTGKRNNVFRSEVTRTYIGIFLSVSLLVAVSLRLAGTYDGIFTAMRQSFFQVASIMTTSGFATANTNLWTPFAMVLLIFCAMICACAGSTSGGIKVDRLLLAVKILRNRVRQQQHPNAVLRVRMDGIMQDESILNSVTLFIVTYFILLFAGTLFSTLCGLDLLTSFSSSAACLANLGPGFGAVGSLDNYSVLPPVVRFFDTFLMLLGRLEIFGLIQLFFIKWWR